MSKVLTMVLAGGEGKRLAPLTADRAKPAVPFGGQYRLIDFALSNLVNANYHQIVVLTQYKSHSLDRHVTTTWRSVVLLAGETALLTAAVALATFVRIGDSAWSLLAGAGILRVVLIVVVCQVSLHYADLYDVRPALHGRDHPRDRGVDIGVADRQVGDERRPVLRLRCGDAVGELTAHASSPASGPATARPSPVRCTWMHSPGHSRAASMTSSRKWAGTATVAPSAIASSPGVGAP